MKRKIPRKATVKAKARVARHHRRKAAIRQGQNPQHASVAVEEHPYL